MPSFHPGTAICRTRIAVGILKHPIPRERRVVHVGGHRIDVTSKEVFVRRNSFIDATGRAVAGAVKWRSTIAQIAGRAAGTEFKGQAKPLDGVIRNRGLQNARLHGNRPPPPGPQRQPPARPRPLPPAGAAGAARAGHHTGAAAAGQRGRRRRA